MIGTMQDLRIDVVEKNAEMEAALASLVMRCEAAFTRLNDVISPSRNARLADARSGIEGSFVQLVAEVSVDTASRFANVVSALEGPQRILDTTTAREEHLYNTQVFQEFEAACGESLRQMERSHFEFDMDKLSVSGMGSGSGSRRGGVALSAGTEVGPKSDPKPDRSDRSDIVPSAQ